MIELASVRKEYEDVVAVENLSLTIPKGEIYGLIGPNGAGKTTTIRILAGLLSPTAGKVRVAGVDLAEKREQAQRHVGYLADFFSVYEELRVWEYLDFFANAHGVKKEETASRVDEVIEQLGLTSKRNALIHGLSRGMKQRLGIGRAVIHKPEVLLLDEPASGLDPKSRVELRNLLVALKDAGTTILISSHILTELEGFCTYVGIMERGRLTHSGPIGDVARIGTTNQTYRLEWLNDAKSIVNEILARHASLSAIALNEKHGTFESSDNDDAAANVLAELVNGGVRVVSFTQVKQSMEELYMNLSTHEVM